MMRIFTLFLLLCTPLFSEVEYHFTGTHFLSSYTSCDHKALTSLDTLMEKMEEAIEATGATILDQAYYVFAPDGLTAVYLLSESHASIHTYPEHDSCFIDLFTCGNNCSWEPFHEKMSHYLEPKSISSQLLIREE